MKKIWSRTSKALVLLAFGLVAVVAILLAPTILSAFGLDAEEVSAVASAVAAVFGALAAGGALLAAQESSSSAREATRAVALAQKPSVRITMRQRERNQTGWMQVEVENLSQHPVRNGALSWVFRDGTSGMIGVAFIPARTTPYGATIHRVEAQETYTLGAFDDSIGGTDRVSFEYNGPSDAVRWKLTQEIVFEVEEGGGSVHERGGEWLRVPSHRGRSQYEVEV